MASMWREVGQAAPFALLLLTGTGLGAALAARGRVRRTGSARQGLAAAALVGSLGLVLLGTALPRTWPLVWEGWGDLVLRPGGGGLGEWRVLFERPASQAALLLVGNVVLYAPLGFLGALLWPAHRGRVLAAGIGLSVLVELWQLAALGRIASLDDVALNAAGVGLGVLAALGLRRMIPAPVPAGAARP